MERLELASRAIAAEIPRAMTRHRARFRMRIRQQDAPMTRQIDAIVTKVARGYTVTVWLRSAEGDRLLSDLSCESVEQAEAIAYRHALDSGIPPMQVELHRR